MGLQTSLGWLAWWWAALALGLCGWAAQLAFAWLDLASRADPRARAVRIAGAAASLGTGLWAAHGLGVSIMPIEAVGRHRLDVELAIWLVAGAIAATAFSWASLGREPYRRWVSTGIVLAVGALAVQAIGLASGDWRIGTDWNPVPLAGALAADGAATLGALCLLRATRGAEPPARARMRWLAAALFGLGATSAQCLVAVAADLSSRRAATPSDWRLPSDMLSALVSAVSTVLLLGLQTLLRRRRSRRESERRARHRLDAGALNDPLTGLPTRQMFEGTLAQAVRHADASGRRLALLVLDIEGVGAINQSFGHTGGDRVLRDVASRLRGLAKAHMAARLAGDEFLILMPDDPSCDDATALALQVRATLARPCAIEQRELTLTCVIGIALYPAHGDPAQLIRHAQAAMATAKRSGGAKHVFFEPRMIERQREEAELTRDLRLALERGQMALAYQPKIDAASGEITGAEALMRWHHPQRGVVSPAVFIPLAESHGLINALGSWLIDESCKQARAWRDDGMRMRVAINLSVHQLRQPDLSQHIGEAMRRHQINPDLITCEITESSAMDDTEITTRVIGELDRLGVHIAIDDFGTGHSSLSYLRKLAADELKIDRSFVLDLETSEEARKVALAVVNLAKALNLKVVAEGVETEGQNRILRDFGCDQLQGFLFAKPMSAKALACWAMEDVGPRTMNFRDSIFLATRATEPV